MGASCRNLPHEARGARGPLSPRVRPDAARRAARCGFASLEHPAPRTESPWNARSPVGARTRDVHAGAPTVEDRTAELAAPSSTLPHERAGSRRVSRAIVPAELAAPSSTLPHERAGSRRVSGSIVPAELAAPSSTLPHERAGSRGGSRAIVDISAEYPPRGDHDAQRRDRRDSSSPSHPRFRPRATPRAGPGRTEDRAAAGEHAFSGRSVRGPRAANLRLAASRRTRGRSGPRAPRTARGKLR